MKRKNTALLLAMYLGILLSACNSGSSSNTTSVAQSAFVANNASNSVSVCAITNGIIGTCATPHTDTTFSNPWGLVFDSNNNLYVANDDNGTISVCPVSNESIGTCVASDGSGTLQGPWGLAFDTINNLYIANSDGNTVSVCPVSNGVLGTCTASAAVFNDPWGVAFFNNTLFVANSRELTVSVCPVSNGVIGTCAKSSGNGTFYYPAGLAFDNNSNLYVANGWTNSISVCPVTFTSGVASIGTCVVNEGFAFFADPLNTNNFSGGGLAFDANFNLYVTESTPNIAACSVSNGSIETCTTGGTSLSTPLGIAIH